MRFEPKYQYVSEEMKDASLQILEILPDDPGEALTVMCYLLSRMIMNIDGADLSSICSAIEGNMQEGNA